MDSPMRGALTLRGRRGHARAGAVHECTTHLQTCFHNCVYSTCFARCFDDLHISRGPQRESPTEIRGRMVGELVSSAQRLRP